MKLNLVPEVLIVKKEKNLATYEIEVSGLSPDKRCLPDMWDLPVNGTTYQELSQTAKSPVSFP
jgi:hypothetical protein